MSERIVLKEIKSKGSFKKENIEQYLRVVYLPEVKRDDEILSKKFRIEVGKIVDGEYTKPVSFQSQSNYFALIIAETLLKAFLILGGDIREIRKLNDRLLNWYSLRKRKELW